MSFEVLDAGIIFMIILTVFSWYDLLQTSHIYYISFLQILVKLGPDQTSDRMEKGTSEQIYTFRHILE